jgi:hypothetical protein
MVFFGEIHVFPQLSRNGPFVAKRAYHQLKHLSCRKYSFQKETQFSKANYVLYASANILLDAVSSNLDGGHSSDKCVSSTQLNRNIWRKQSLSVL